MQAAVATVDCAVNDQGQAQPAVGVSVLRLGASEGGPATADVELELGGGVVQIVRPLGQRLRVSASTGMVAGCRQSLVPGPAGGRGACGTPCGSPAARPIAYRRCRTPTLSVLSPAP